MAKVNGREDALLNAYLNRYQTAQASNVSTGRGTTRKAQQQGSAIMNATDITGYADGRVAKQNSYAVYITKSGSKYHADGCSYLRGSKIAVDVNEAIKSGYMACSRCNP